MAEADILDTLEGTLSKQNNSTSLPDGGSLPRHQIQVKI